MHVMCVSISQDTCKLTTGVKALSKDRLWARRVWGLEGGILALGSVRRGERDHI